MKATTQPTSKQGRPKKLDCYARTVWLDDETADKARKLGGNNMSAGIRKAIAEYGKIVKHDS